MADVSGTDFEAAAVRALEAGFGAGAAAATAVAPGRVTLVGDHVDYVGGRIACLAIDRWLAVAARRSADGRWRVLSNGRRVQREALRMAGDIGDRVLSAAVVLGRRGIVVPPLEIGVAGDLPASAGLSSSAAVTTASLVAMLRHAGSTLSASELVAAAVAAERDVVGVPCGELDQAAVVHSRSHAVLVLDCAARRHKLVPWPWPDVGLVVAASGESHDVGGGDYLIRRRAAERACAILHVTGCQEIGGRWRELPPEVLPRGRHIATETRRTDAAVTALESGDVEELGRLISASHASLRDDHEVSTDRLDAMVLAARRIPGCHGARLVGAGFGGSVIALVDRGAATACAAAMAAAAGADGGTWLVHPADGVAVTAGDVIAPAGMEEPAPTGGAPAG